MKKFWIIIILIIALVAGLFVWRHEAKAPAGALSAAEKNTAGGIVVSTQTINESDFSGAYQITAEYPVVSGIASASASAINTAMKQAVQNDVDNFKSGEAGNANAQNAAGPGQSTLDITFATTTNPVAGLVSFRLDENFYSAGAAHPGEQIDTYTFDVNSGALVALPDLFTGNFLDTLSAQSRALLVQSLGADADIDMINEGTDPSDATNFADFLPETDGLHVIFNQYQVAPYAAGVQEITIPYASLKSVVNPSGVLAGVK